MSLAAEDYRVDITSDHMEASLVLLNENVRSQITVDALRTVLQQKGVTHGIDEQRLAQLAAQPAFNKPLIIARGKANRDGENETIQYKFEVAKEKIVEDENTGSIDFRNIKNFTNFRAGDVLAVKTPATQGESGYTVMGEELKGRDGKTVNLRLGKGATVTEDGMTAKAEVDGHACVIADRLTVLSTVEVPAHVDYSIGNINFVGNVKVKGSVRSGFSVVAEGDIDISGNVEKSVIKTKGNLTINGIVFGGGECEIEVGGTATIGALDQARLKVIGDLKVTNYIRHSDIACGGMIEVLGKKGSIVAGDVHAYRGITAPFIGNNMATMTKLTVGTNPTVTHDLETIEEQIKAFEEKLKQVKNALTALISRRSAAGGQLDPKNEALLEKLRAAELQMLPEKQRLEVQLEEDKKHAVDFKDAKIRISQIVYPGVIICFRDRMQYKTRDELQCCSFYEENAEIRTGPF